MSMIFIQGAVYFRRKRKWKKGDYGNTLQKENIYLLCQE
jgi:phosphoribosyl-AMP cyclohydrolase